MQKYSDFIFQTVDFPTEEFTVKKNELYFNDIRLTEIIKEHGTPLKISYLPKIGSQIQKAKDLFATAMKKHGYAGHYHYAYCTKASHFRFVTEEVLKFGTHIETSSAYDLPLIRRLYENHSLPKETFIICNGFKRQLYTQYITEFIHEGFNCIPVLDNLKELDVYEKTINGSFNMGIRLAADEEPNFEFYTSRLGVRYADVTSFCEKRIAGNDRINLKMLHFFINTGINDSSYYWNELNRFIKKYCELKKICPELDSIDIGGGFPVKNSLRFEYDYESMVDQIIETISNACAADNVEVPDIFTEFGTFTVAESGAVIYSVLDQKLQNDKELWYMIEGSFINDTPDVWGIKRKYILLPVNNWDKSFHKVHLGGLTCDSMDFYNSDSHHTEVFLPVVENGATQYIGLFHTGAYQESLGGFGGIRHCLVPSPKHILIKKTAAGEIVTEVFSPEQPEESVLKILGY